MIIIGIVMVIVYMSVPIIIVSYFNAVSARYQEETGQDDSTEC